EAGAWVTYTDEQAHCEPARWVQRQIEETGRPVALRASSMLTHLEAIRAGTGRGVLPCYVSDGHPLLERLTPPIPEIAAEYWIIVHLDLRRSPNILIAEGTPAAWQAEPAEFGIPSNFSLFAAARHLPHPEVRCVVLNITDGESFPRGTTLADFDGVMFSGS